MEIADHARALAKALRGASWFNSVGIGQEDGKDCIFVYVVKSPPANNPELSNTVKRYPVVIRKTGRVRTNF